MKPVFLIILLSWLLVPTEQALASEIPNDTTYIFLKDYGLYKTKKKNAVKYFYKALEDLKPDHPKVLVFSTGTYHFYPDGCVTKVYSEAEATENNSKICAFHFENIKNLVIDGRGSRLIFHQEMQPFTFDNCENVTLKNLSIDWEQPLIAQAEVLRVTDNYIDIGLDPKESPYRMVDGKLFFDGANGEQNKWNRTLEFDRKSRLIVPYTGESPCLGPSWDDYYAEPTMPGIVRLHFEFKRKPQIGNYLVMDHAKSSHAGVYIHESKNIEVNNLRLFHAAGAGIVANGSNNITINRYQAIPNRIKNRYFSGLTEGLRLSGCIGEIVVKNSTFQGLMSNAVVCNNSNPPVTTSNTADNRSQLSILTIEHNNFNSCRGCGILLSAPENVKIENNTFETSGSAILLTGRMANDQQTAAIKNVEVINNIFNPLCNSSTYKLNEAIITISPDITTINEETPFLHKNIIIQNNQFYPFDFPLIYAMSVDGLDFNRNKINQNSEIEPFHERLYNFTFEYCKNISFTENEFSEDYKGRNMLLRKTTSDQLNTDLTNSFSIEMY